MNLPGYKETEGRSPRPCGLRHSSATARLLELWVRIPAGSWMSMCCECCEVQVSATGRSLVQRSSTERVSPSVIRCK